MANYMQEAFAPVDAVNREIVYRDTWRHLAPEPRRTYRGYIVYAYGAWGDIVPVDSEFDGLSSSPWFFEDMNNYICEQITETTAVGIYRFDGTYTRFKNGSCRFSGKIRTIALDK